MIEGIVREHYGVGGLAERIVAGLTATGVDIDRLTVDDLAIIDEFHIGGRQATEHALSKLSLTGDEHVIDVGCGIGGAARFIASQSGCRVTGIDLTPEFIEAARVLTRLTGLEERVNFQIASALDMPLADDAFDAAITIHVAMNIRDRDALYREIARVLKPGAPLCVYDVMKKGDGPIAFPVPWAESDASSHLTTPEDMRALLDDAGFEVGEVEDRTEFAVAYIKQRAATAAATDEPSPLGPQLIMGPTFREKFQNLRGNIASERIGPAQIIARKKTR